MQTHSGRENELIPTNTTFEHLAIESYCDESDINTPTHRALSDVLKYPALHSSALPRLVKEREHCVIMARK